MLEFSREMTMNGKPGVEEHVVHTYESNTPVKQIKANAIAAASFSSFVMQKNRSSPSGAISICWKEILSDTSQIYSGLK